MPPGSSTGTTVIACADVVTAKAKAAKAINLIISFLPCFANYSRRLVTAFRVRRPTRAGERFFQNKAADDIVLRCNQT
jgi:hypothetical protein